MKKASNNSGIKEGGGGILEVCGNLQGKNCSPINSSTIISKVININMYFNLNINH